MASQRTGKSKQVGRLRSSNFLHLDKEFDSMKARFDNDSMKSRLDNEIKKMEEEIKFIDEIARVETDFGYFFGLDSPSPVDRKHGMGRKGFDCEMKEREKTLKIR